MKHLRTALLTALLSIGLGGAAQAAPCASTTPNLRLGAKFAGEVRHVIDGRTICVGRSLDKTTWIPVRLSDLPAQPGWRAKRTLLNLAKGKYAVCTAAEPAVSPQKPVSAVCRVTGVSLAGQVRKPNWVERRSLNRGRP